MENINSVKIICTNNHSHTTDCIDEYNKALKITFKMNSDEGKSEYTNKEYDEYENDDGYDEYENDDGYDEYEMEREEYEREREEYLMDKCLICSEVSGGGLCLDCKQSV